MADEQKPAGSPSPAPPGAGDANPKAGASRWRPLKRPLLSRPRRQRRPSRLPPWLPPPGIASWRASCGRGLATDRAKLPLTSARIFWWLKPDAVIPILEYLKLEADFDYLVDITAVDWPKRAERFELVYIVYSFSRNRARAA